MHSPVYEGFYICVYFIFISVNLFLNQSYRDINIEKMINFVKNLPRLNYSYNTSSLTFISYGLHKI